jgi:hypothetical protein
MAAFRWRTQDATWQAMGQRPMVLAPQGKCSEYISYSEAPPAGGGDWDALTMK